MADPATDVPSSDTAQQYLKAPDVASRPSAPAGGGDNIVDLANYRQPNIDQDIKNLTGALIPMTQQKIAADKQATEEFQKRSAEDRANMERASRAQAYELSSLDKTWDADKEMSTRSHTAMENFGSAGAILATLASAFVHMPMTSALNAAAAYNNAVKEGDEKAYEHAFVAFKENANLAVKRANIEHQLYEEANGLYKTDAAAWSAKMTAIATQFNDQKTLAFLNAGMDKEVFDAIAGRANAAAKIAEATDKVTESRFRNDAFQAAVKADPKIAGNPELMLETWRQTDPNTSTDAKQQYEFIRESWDKNGRSPDQDEWHEFKLKQASEKWAGFASRYSAPGTANAEDALKQWTADRGSPPTAEMRAIIADAYATRGANGPAKIAQVGDALANIKARLTMGEKLSDADQEKILRAAIREPLQSVKPDIAALGWTPDAIDAAAATFNKTSKLPSNLGSRQYAGAIMGAIQNRAAAMLREEGKTTDDRARQWQLYSAQRVGQSRFLSGPQGNRVVALNTIVQHLGTLNRLADALDNGDIRLFNQIAQSWAEQTGDPAPTNFDTARTIVGTEIIKALGVAGAGTGAERQEAADAFARAASPQQIKGAINDSIRPLLIGQLRSLRQQFPTATGLPADTFDDMLDPETRVFFEVHKEPETGKTPAETLGLPPRDQRQKNGTYNTPMGLMRWTGTGWIKP